MNFVTSQNIVKSTIVPHQNLYERTSSPDMFQWLNEERDGCGM